ncbi:MAG TPA: hypothetical protein VKR53_09460 [Puia sp.]|nr:hypothetical protein [Puia sp.]
MIGLNNGNDQENPGKSSISGKALPERVDHKEQMHADELQKKRDAILISYYIDMNAQLPQRFLIQIGIILIA